MYVRASTRKNKTGQVVRYLQLAHNEWDPTAGASRTKILHSFGREDQLDRPAIERLVTALSILLDPATAATACTPTGMTFTDSRPLGGTHALDGLWHRLGIDTAIGTALTGRRVDAARVERILFALTASRVLHPCSKLAATDWITHDAHIQDLPTVSDDGCYRAMDALLDIEGPLAQQIYYQVADLLNLEVDLLFFDTTSTYFETGEPDEATARDQNGRLAPEGEISDPVGDVGFRTHGKSKDHRDDLPQVVIGMAVTREGIPVRVWSWPGNTGDQALIRQVKKDLRDWSLARIVWVADRGFSSDQNRRYLQRGGGQYIIGEKLRTSSPEVQAALSRQGRYQGVRENMMVKEVTIEDAADRFVICFNPEQAERDQHVRAQLLSRLEEMITGTDALTSIERTHLQARIATRAGLNRFLRVTATGLLRTDRKAVAAEERLDGKYLLRCSDPKLSAEDIAVGYKQLLEVERGWRDMKSVLDLRPVYHRLEDRIRAHVLLCWLGLLLIRVAETSTGRTWNTIRTDLQRLHLITYTGPAGTFAQSTEPTKPHRDLFAALHLDPPKKIIQISPDASPPAGDPGA